MTTPHATTPDTRCVCGFAGLELAARGPWHSDWCPAKQPGSEIPITTAQQRKLIRAHEEGIQVEADRLIEAAQLLDDAAQSCRRHAAQLRAKRLIKGWGYSYGRNAASTAYHIIETLLKGE